MFSPFLAGRGGGAIDGRMVPEPQQKVLLDTTIPGCAYEIGSIDGARGESSTRDLAASRGCRPRSTLSSRRARASGRARCLSGLRAVLNGSASRPQYSARAATSRRSRTRPRRRSTSRASSANVMVKFKHSISSRRTRRTASSYPPTRVARRPRARASTSRRGGTSPAPSRPAA